MQKYLPHVVCFLLGVGTCYGFWSDVDKNRYANEANLSDACDFYATQEGVETVMAYRFEVGKTYPDCLILNGNLREMTRSELDDLDSYLTASAR